MPDANRNASSPRIFLALAGPAAACGQTLQRAFAQATHPGRIRAGVASPEPADYLLTLRPGQVQLARGPHLADTLALRENADFVLLLAAGAELRKGWDDTLLAAYAHFEAQGYDPVLTAYLPAEKPAPGTYARMRITKADLAHGTVALAAKPTRPAKHKAVHATPLATPHLLFMPAHAAANVPVDPYIPFPAFPLAYSARLWTHGYTLFQPDAALGTLPTLAATPGTEIAIQRARHVLGLACAEQDAALIDLDRYAHGTERTLDEFWHFAGIDTESGRLTPAAASGDWDTPTLAARPLPRIFVQIASYRDPECQHTVQDLFAQAAHPERIFVGICWQRVPEEDRACFDVPYPYPLQVRVIEKDARQSLGAAWARALTQTLWRGEEYTLQIDSHMRFEPGWDNTLLEMLSQAEQTSTRAVLSTYPAAYTPPRDIPQRVAFRIVAKEFDADGVLTLRSLSIPESAADGPPLPGAFIGACMLFGRSTIIRDVPYDPHLYFFGEEITMAVRLWTHGYDIYHPQRPVLYHYWKRTQRPTHFHDHPQAQALNARSLARVRHLLGTEDAADPAVLKDIERYGFGKARNLAGWQELAGVDFARKTIVSPSTLTPPPAMTTPPKPSGEPRKVFENQDCIVFDDFLPEQDYERLYQFASECDYAHINTHGPVKRVWDLGNGFPLRGAHNVFYYCQNVPDPKPEWVYPSPAPLLDRFIDRTNRYVPHVSHLVGQAGVWEYFSVSAWLYPPGTGLSLHDDGAGVYSGAYVYFLSPVWKPHWGGQLLVAGHAANEAIHRYKHESDAYAIYRRKWLHSTLHDDLVMEHGLAQCIFPKRNRMVFIHPDAYHMVTQVLPAAGDNVRMSLAGFFHRPKKPAQP